MSEQVKQVKSSRGKGRRRSRAQSTRRRMRAEFICSCVLLSLILGLMAYAYLFSPWGVNELSEAGKLAPPSAAHPFGTDHLSRDILTRVGQGASGTLIVALGTVLVGAFLGLILGALAGYYGGWTDWLISRFTDSLLAFPGILMALLVITVLGRGLPQLILALGLAFTPSFARIVRSAFKEYRGRNFVKRLEVMGTPPWRILFVHIAPLLREQYLNALGIGLANAILAESSMSFLGFGVQAPRPSWGSMLADAQPYVFRAPSYALFPGLAIVLTVFSIFMFSRSGLKLSGGGEYEV